MASESPDQSKVDIYLTNIDISSMTVMFNITCGYVAEANMIFSNDGISILECNSENNVFIETIIPKELLIHYEYNMVEEQYYAGFELKKIQGNFNSIPSKQVCNMYKLEGNDSFFTIGEITLNKDGANKLKTCSHPIFRDIPPDITFDPLVKINAADFSALCVSLGKLSCKKIEFSRGKNTLYVKGMREDGKNEKTVKNIVTQRSFKNSTPFDMNEEDAEEDDSLTVNYNIIKPLIKINKICKNGIVNVYFFKIGDKNMLALKVNVGQIGLYSIYFRDS